MNVRLPKDEDIRIANTEDVARIMQKVLLRQNRINRQKEYFWTIGLSGSLDIQYIELVALGALNAVSIDPVEIFHIAVSKKCKRIILVHNHPSGDLKPSKSDIEVTKRILEGGKLLGIHIDEHMIISETDFKCFIEDIA